MGNITRNGEYYTLNFKTVENLTEYNLDYFNRAKSSLHDIRNTYYEYYNKVSKLKDNSANIIVFENRDILTPYMSRLASKFMYLINCFDDIEYELKDVIKDFEEKNVADLESKLAKVKSLQYTNMDIVWKHDNESKSDITADEYLKANTKVNEAYEDLTTIDEANKMSDIVGG